MRVSLIQGDFQSSQFDGLRQPSQAGTVKSVHGKTMISGLQEESETTVRTDERWSGLSESNRHLNLGKVPYYHYTKAAQTQLFITRLHQNQQANLFTLFFRISCSRNSTRPAKPVPISPRETAAGGRRIVSPCPCPCRRARTSHRLRNTRSPKNDGGASACLY